MYEQSGRCKLYWPPPLFPLTKLPAYYNKLEYFRDNMVSSGKAKSIDIEAMISVSYFGSQNMALRCHQTVFSVPQFTGSDHAPAKQSIDPLWSINIHVV